MRVECSGEVITGEFGEAVCVGGSWTQVPEWTLDDLDTVAAAQAFAIGFTTVALFHLLGAGIRAVLRAIQM